MSRTAWMLLPVLTALAAAAIAQSKDAAPAEAKPACGAVVATLMIGRVDCTAVLCNTGASQKGVGGALSRALVKESIDAASFGNGVAAMLGTALNGTGCFEVFDPVAAEAMRKDLAAAGGVPAAMPTVDYLIKVAITKAERSVDRTQVAFFKNETATSTLGLDTKLVHPARGAVLVASNYEASSDRVSSGMAIPLFSQSSSAAKADPFAGAAAEVVVKAANGLTQQILAQVKAQPARPSATAATSAGVPSTPPVMNPTTAAAPAAQ